MLDLYVIATALGCTFGIERPNPRLQRRRVAVRWWRRYKRFGDRTALDHLLAHNREDTLNLYPLAEHILPQGEHLLGSPS